MPFPKFMNEEGREERGRRFGAAHRVREAGVEGARGRGRAGIRPTSKVRAATTEVTRSITLTGRQHRPMARSASGVNESAGKHAACAPEPPPSPKTNCLLAAPA